MSLYRKMRRRNEIFVERRRGKITNSMIMEFNAAIAEERDL